MGFSVPAVHYSALATLPPDISSSISQHSIKDTANIRFKLGQLFKRLLNNEQNEIHQQIENQKDVSMIIENPNNNNSDHRMFIEQKLKKSIPSSVESLERLPFTEPYSSIPSKTDKLPFELSAYHKNCMRQEKSVDHQGYYYRLSSMKENRSYLTNSTIENPDKKFNNKRSNSHRTLTDSSSIENCIALKYATQKKSSTINHDIHSSDLQPIQHLRRLQSKSKIRPILNQTKPSTSISSSIAHRIELLKKSMHNPQLEIHPIKLQKSSSSQSLIEPIHKQTQTINSPLKSSEIHHIHHHHIYSSSSSSFFSFQWRTCLSLIGIFLILFFLLIELITFMF